MIGNNSHFDIRSSTHKKLKQNIYGPEVYTYIEIFIHCIPYMCIPYAGYMYFIEGYRYFMNVFCSSFCCDIYICEIGGSTQVGK